MLAEAVIVRGLDPPGPNPSSSRRSHNTRPHDQEHDVVYIRYTIRSSGSLVEEGALGQNRSYRYRRHRTNEFLVPEVLKYSDSPGQPFQRSLYSTRNTKEGSSRTIERVLQSNLRTNIEHRTERIVLIIYVILVKKSAKSEIVCEVLVYENDVCSLTWHFCFPFFGCPKHVISVGSAVL